VEAGVFLQVVGLRFLVSELTCTFLLADWSIGRLEVSRKGAKDGT
jgi:hypothetical protein